jgi:HK97 family phage major capsid protein
LVNIDTLKRDLTAIVNQARAINDLAKTEKRALTQEEQTKFNRFMLDIDDKKTEIRVGAKNNHKEMGGSGEGPDPFAEGRQCNWSEKRIADDPRSYRSMFYKNEVGSLDTGDFKNIGEFLQVVHSERYDPRLKEKRFHLSGTGELGGFSVPEEFGAWLLDSSIEDEIVRPRATVHAMQSSTKHIPAWDSLDKSTGNLLGGMSAAWVPELGVIPQQSAAMRSMTLKAETLAILADVSNELLQDATDFENVLGQGIVRTIGYELDRAFLTGTGAGAAPVGVLNNPALLEVTRTGFPSAAPGDNFIDLVQMYSRFFKGGPGRGLWIMHPDVLPELITMTDVNGNLIWQGGARDQVPSTLFDLPITYSEKVPGPTEPGCIILANLFHYQVGLRQEIQIDKSNAPGWNRNYTSYRCLLRGDGQGSWNKPMTLPNGSEVSWSVALQ